MWCTFDEPDPSRGRLSHTERCSAFLTKEDPVSLTLTHARKGALVGAVAAIALGASAGGAQAASKTLTYNAQFPLVGSQPVTATTTGTIPAVVKAGKPIAPLTVKTKLAFGGDTPAFFALIGASSVEGAANVAYKVSGPGVDLTMAVPQTISSTTLPAYPGAVTLNATGQTPTLTFPKGRYTVSQVGVGLNLLAREATGTPIADIPPAVGGVDSDGDPNTFDVALSLNPTTQNTVLGTFVAR
jgi:hypothetical protein